MELQDIKGNTAFCFAAASGNMDIARLLLHKNSFLPLIRGGNGRTPLHFAAMQGRCHMTRFLYDLTKPVFQDQDCQLLFFTSIHTANYVDNQNQSIIHTAVSHRHASIFNLVHEIGSHKDIIVTYIVEGSNTLLHLAAKLAPQGQLELVSGAAFQMSLELIWFEEVKKIMPPSFIKLRNSESLTAQELFTREHEELRKKAEDWMKRTAEFCMLISTVIATGVFSTAINIPGGIDDQTKKPNYLDKTSFLAFAISDATAFISSAAAILIFFSILISRYAEYDFYKSLPLKLIFGLITLFIS
ncbi:uncharacterized protein LOC109810209, partial [Cajanus cajan]